MMKLKYRTWNDICITTWKKLRDLQESTDLTDMEKNMRLVSLLTEEPLESVELLPAMELQGLLAETTWLKTFSFDQKHCPSKLKLGGRKFRVVMDVTKLTTAQYIDFQNFYPTLQNDYGKVLACFVIPKEAKGYGDNYDPLELGEFLENNVSLPLANQLMFFFLKRLVTSIKIIVAYFDFLIKRSLKKDPNNPALMEAKKRMEEQMKRIMPTSGLPGLI